MGGCPAGPQELRPNAPTVYTGKGAGAGKIAVTWGAGTNTPESPSIDGYSVTAVRSVATGLDAGGVVRTAADGRSATVEGLTAGEIYSVEVAARSAAGDSEPAVMRVRAADHVVPTATASTTREPNSAGKYPVLMDGPNGDFGVQLDPVPGLLDPEVHYTVDGSTPTLTSPTFVPGVDAGLTIRQDTTVKWLVVDSGNIVGPAGSKFFDIVESTNPAPEFTSVVAAPVSGAVDVTFTKLDVPDAYRVQAYTGDSTSTATGVRVGSVVQFLEPTTADATVTRRISGLENGTSYRFSVAARYGTVWSGESALSDAVAPAAGSAANAGPDQTVLRGRKFTLDGSASPKATSWTWTQVRPTAVNNGGLPQDPALDLNPNLAGVQSTTGPTTTPTLELTVPLLTTATSDHTLQFRLNTVHSDGLTRADLVDIKAQADTITAEEVRWRAGDEIGGTGSQENARLTLLNGGPTGQFISTVLVTNGEWTFPGGAPALVNGTLYVWSDFGYTGTIRTTN
jgi:hypothetical protein